MNCSTSTLTDLLLVGLWLLPVCVLAYHGYTAIRFGSQRELAVGIVAMFILALPGALAGAVAAAPVYEWLCGPIPAWRDAARMGAIFVYILFGSPCGITIGCLLGLMAARCVRMRERSARGHPA